jgi:hypothetical protein
MTERTPGANFSYPSSAAAVVFGVHLSARAVFRLDRNIVAVLTDQDDYTKTRNYWKYLIVKLKKKQRGG